MSAEPAALLIGLREGLEALLIVGILLGILSRLGHRDKRHLVWIGAGAGVAASVLLGLIVQATLGTWFSEGGGAALFEIVVALAAVAVLSWMVLWMHGHARTMVSDLRERVTTAAGTGGWLAIAALAFATVLREGVETVLFFQALSSQAAWGDLLLGGVLGFGLSALIALAIFRFTVQVDVRRFFAITGVLLIFIAAGLVVHVAHAAAEVGLVPGTGALWDTSGVLPDEDHWLGGPLHAFVGYEDQPTLLQLVLYTTYLVGVGGWYLASLRPETRRGPARRTAALALAGSLLLLSLAGAMGAGSGEPVGGHDHDLARASEGQHPHERLLAAAEDLEENGLRVGLLVRDHGEFIAYDEGTFEAVKAFVDHIWPATGLPRELLAVDQGTWFLDEAHPWSSEPHSDARLVDAWLATWTLPAVPVTDPAGITRVDETLGGQLHLVTGTGPGLGEGDLYEVFALGVYRQWLKMDNHSPRYEQGWEGWRLFEAKLADHFGERLTVAFAHGIDPGVGRAESIETAAARLASADVDVVLDAYQSSIHSDAMDTCIMAPHAERALRAAGFEGPIVQVGQAGLTEAWAGAVAAHVAEHLTELPGDAPASVHLAQHGARVGSESNCGQGPDPYHANAEAQFARAAEAIGARLGSGLTVRQVYGQGAADPEDGVLSPAEALALEVDEATRHVLVVPYEFWGDAFDNLVVLREGLGFTPAEAPYYDAGYETRFTHRGIDVTVTTAHFGLEAKVDALLTVVAEAVLGLPAQGAP